MQLSDTVSSNSSSSNLKTTAHPTFIHKRSQQLTTLNLVIEEYEHQATGAVHYHLASDNPENVFLVALRTVPMDSTGVAHILEHTALCGSKKFPVRDPFFMMIRRSLNTFMNAFTSSDWTAYPFASQNRKDFQNLIEVYLDAVFFSSLNELDFAQEGHRIEFSEPENPDSPLEYKGVVFNEMKGAMSAPTSRIWQQFCNHLFPTTTYHFNSGGEPTDIPELSYTQLKAFYKTHYHPSNAIFMTYGDIPAIEHQANFETLALNQFEKLDVHISVGDEQRLQSPIRVTEHYALDEDDTTDKSHVVVGWLLGKSTDLKEMVKAQLLSGVLLDNSASPLLQALETTELGRSPSPLCGLEDSHKEMSFMCGLEGCPENKSEEIENLIIGTLTEIADNGISQDKVEAALHSLELSQREISGDSYPYGLQLILAALSTATHRGDPIELLNIDPVLETLKSEIKDPDYIPKLIREYLLDNSHRITLTVHPDKALSGKQAAEEADKLSSIKQNLDEQGIKNLIHQAALLKQRQEQEDDADLLPKITLEDVPAAINWPESSRHEVELDGRQSSARFYAQGTNGISYQQVILSMPELDKSLTTLLPYYTSCLPDLGIGNKSYLEIQALQAAFSGGIGVHNSIRSAIDDEQSVSNYLTFSSKSLYANQGKVTELLRDTLLGCRFDEHQRIRELIEQISARKEQSITSQGHSLAIGVACRKMSPIAEMNYLTSGMAGIQHLKTLTNEFSNRDKLAEFSEGFSQLHERILQADKQFLLISEDREKEVLLESLATCWSGTSEKPDHPNEMFTLPSCRKKVNDAWLANTQVNFCGMAFPTVPVGHEDAAPLTVLGGFLRNGFLHRAVREQGGAYGGGASQDSGTATFRFYSYRDPRLTATLDDYKHSIDWLLEAKHDPQALEEAILGVISSLDKPSSPAGTARQAFYNELFGRDQDQSALFRKEILQVSIEQLIKVTETYLASTEPSLGIISNKAHEKELESLHLDIHQL
jgi:Zn-dependent M16 (insulinase) family peptidase